MNLKLNYRLVGFFRKHWIMAVIVLISFAVRVYAVSANLPHLYWHDENNFVETALRFGSGNLQPYGFRHGTFLSFILLFAYGIWYSFLRLLGLVNSPDGFALRYIIDPTNFYIIGRMLVALTGVGTVFLTYLAGRRLYGERAGILSAFFIGLSFLAVNMSIQIKADMVATFFLLCAFLFCVRIVDSVQREFEVKRINYIFAGLFIGLAAAAKYTSLLGYVFFVVAHMAGFSKRNRRRALDANFLLGNLFVFIGFFIGEPQAAINPLMFIRELSFLHMEYITMNTDPAPWALLILQHIRNSVGLPLVICILLGVVVGLVRHPFKSFFVMSYPLVLMLILCHSRGFTHHYLPAIPFLAMFAGYGVDAVGREIPRKHGYLIFLAAGLLVLPSFANSLRLLQILKSFDTRTLAKNWVERSVPEGSKILVEGALNNKIVLGPPLNEDAETLKEDLDHISSQATKRPLNMRLEYVTNNPSLKSYRLFKAKRLLPEMIKDIRPDYVITSGYFDAELIEHEMSGDVSEYLKKRQVLIKRLKDQYRLIKHFEPWPEFNVFFPLLMRDDYKKFSKIGFLGRNNQLLQGPEIKIYQRQ